MISILIIWPIKKPKIFNKEKIECKEPLFRSKICFLNLQQKRVNKLNTEPKLFSGMLNLKNIFAAY